MALNYASNYSSDLLTVINQGTLTSPFQTNDVKWLNAKTFHFSNLTTSGLKDYTRGKNGFAAGSFNMADNSYTVTHDRGIEFPIDKADVDETAQAVTIEKISANFTQTHVVPEVDAYFFSTVATKAVASGLSSSTALSAYTTENVYSKLKSYLTKGKLRTYAQQGALVFYVRSDIMDLLERSTEFNRQINVQSIGDEGLSITSRVAMIDNVPFIEVSDVDRFYDKFDYSDGFKPVQHTASVIGSHGINVLAASQLTCKTVNKINAIYMYAPGQVGQGDCYLYQYRSLWDTFVFPNGLNNTVDSIYVDLDTAEVGA
jgi:hypothetical protein